MHYTYSEDSQKVTTSPNTVAAADSLRRSSHHKNSNKNSNSNSNNDHPQSPKPRSKKTSSNNSSNDEQDLRSPKSPKTPKTRAFKIAQTKPPNKLYKLISPGIPKPLEERPEDDFPKRLRVNGKKVVKSHHDTKSNSNNNATSNYKDVKIASPRKTPSKQRAVVGSRPSAMVAPPPLTDSPKRSPKAKLASPKSPAPNSPKAKRRGSLHNLFNRSSRKQAADEPDDDNKTTLRRNSGHHSRRESSAPTSQKSPKSAKQKRPTSTTVKVEYFPAPPPLTNSSSHTSYGEMNLKDTKERRRRSSMSQSEHRRPRQSSIKKKNRATSLKNTADIEAKVLLLKKRKELIDMGVAKDEIDLLLPLPTATNKQQQ